MEEEWSYKLVIDLSYEKTLQSIYAKEWLDLQGKINSLLKEGQFIAESCQVYRLQSPLERQYLFRALEAVLDLQVVLLEQQWILEFNLLFVFTNSLNNQVQLLCCDLPDVNKVWLTDEECLLSKSFTTQNYGNFYSVEPNLGKEKISQEELSRTAQPLISRLKTSYEKKQACLLVDRALNERQDVFIKLLNLCFPNSCVIKLAAFSARREPSKLLQPLINYCNRVHNTNFPTVLGLWSVAYLKHSFAAELQKVMAKEDLILVIEDNQFWNNELKNVLSVLLELKIPLFLTFSADTFLTFDRSKFTNMLLLHEAEEIDSKSLFKIFQTALPKSVNSENSCSDTLSIEEQNLLIFVAKTQGLLRWNEMLTLWPEQRKNLEHLFILELVKDEQGYLFTQRKITTNSETSKMYRELLDYWSQKKEQFDLEHLFFLSECRLLSESDLLKVCQQLAERQMLPSLLELAKNRKEQAQSWPDYCNYLLSVLGAKGEDYKAYLSKNNNSDEIFLKALFYYEHGEYEQARRCSQKLLLDSENRHPLYADALFLQMNMLTRQKKFLDARFLLDQIEYNNDCSPFKKFLIIFYRSINFFHQNKLDKAEKLINILITQPLYFPYWEGYAYFLKVRLLFLLGAYKETAMLAKQLSLQAEKQDESQWTKISYLWYLRSLSYLGEYDKVIEKCLKQPLSCERDFMLAETYLFSGKKREAILILESLLDRLINAVPPDADGFQSLDALAHAPTYQALLQEVHLLLALAYLLEGQISQADRCLRLYKLDKDLSGCERFYYILFLKEKLDGNSHQKKHSLYLSHAVSLASSQLYAIEDTTLRASVQQQNIWYRHIAASTTEFEQLFPLPS